MIPTYPLHITNHSSVKPINCNIYNMTSPPALKDTNLFKPIKVGSIELQNRLAFAPTTRFRNTDDFIATNLIKKHYTDRAENNGGLLITEATFVSPQAGLYPNGPMIQTNQQAEAWKQVVDAVHSKGTCIAMQLWHLGRAANAKTLKEHGVPYLAPSAEYFDKDRKKVAIESENELREFTIDEVNQIIEDFKQGAINAIDVSGFDFVEIHSAHMYTLAQFIDIASNHRTDEYGGSIENRTRLALEVVDALIDAVGADKVGIRISPYATFQGGSGAESKLMHPIAQYAYLYSELERRGREGKRLAYVHSVEPRVALGVDVEDSPEYSTEWVRQIWKGVLIRAGGYLHQPNYEKLIRDVSLDDRTLIGVSRYYTSNPDLVHRLKNGLELTKYDRNTFYTGGNYGYNTWGKYGEVAKGMDSNNAKLETLSLV
ncbi:unnamed protein product [Ambrosiozyma monospora]|uniref:Unnamed protein product n=1 Tax=Ambrosiozyma monospora TaxID=43982 RepID=A0ACB5T4U8_AMBMO|nr:unnamed protein product [Ambrosiozyma monospora]